LADASQYKCPNCGTEIHFDSAPQKAKCPFCEKELEAETLLPPAAEPDEPAAQEAEQASELRGLVEQAQEEEAADVLQPEEDAPKAIKSPGALAWLVAILVMFFGLVMFMPFLCNTLLGLFALDGLVKEATKDYEGAQEAYGFLEQTEMEIAMLGSQVFALGDGSVPAYTIGSFVNERLLVMFSRQWGPMSQYTMQYFSQWFPEGTRVPRSLRLLDDIVQAATNVREERGLADEEDEDAYRRAIAAAREKDKRRRALIYDVLELYALADESIVSDEVGQLLETLQKARGSKPWMYEDVAQGRAIFMGDFEYVVRQCEERLRRDDKDYSAMLFHVKALYLTGEKEKAYALAESYSGEHSILVSWMLLYQAEMKYRDGDFEAAVALADEVAAAAAADPQLAQYAPEALSYKATALLLSGRAQEALDLLRGSIEENSYDIGNNTVSTLLAAALAAGDEDYYEAFMESETMMIAQIYYGYAVPLIIEELKAGETTLEAIFTEGWGGFNA